jgi:flagellar M-ring protein FliF
MELIQKIRLAWGKIGLVQRALLIAIVLTLLGGVAFLVRWAKQPQMCLLYQGLTPDDAAAIVEKISQNNIPYQLRSGGTSIYVPKEYVYRLRLDMAKEGLPSGGQGGYKLIENLPVGMSPTVLEANLKRVLQEELAKSIQMIDGVVFARVHLDNPQSPSSGPY